MIKKNPRGHAISTGLTIVIKIGTSSICDEVTHLPRLSNLSLLVETVLTLKQAGHHVVLVTSGAVGVGMRRLNLEERPKQLSKLQAVAAVGQGRLMSLYDDLFNQFSQPIAQILLTRNDVVNRTAYINAKNTVKELLEMGVVPIVNENDTVSVSEIRFGDNDTLSAITAGMINADYLFLLTDVDCLYTDNPRINPAAVAVTLVEDIEALRNKVSVSSSGSAIGTGGMFTKLIAAELATAAGVTCVICRGSTPQFISSIIAYHSSTADEASATAPTVPLHTLFVAKQNPMVDRKWWILHGVHTAGTIFIDEGAMRAITNRQRSSLFAAGIVGVEGTFVADQAVRVAIRMRRAEDGTEEIVEVGKGLVNYSSMEVSRIRGCKSSQIAELLGYADAESVIHRNNLVITMKQL
ncbi:uncharacterized protein VTP21DRAFT_10529 [Calcarisporiella thermophila]|uniref:uncharacterized protein n=1 Tax=Calcarisporiella thermophila TaxID=911321 RepID=UPI0037425B6A